MAVIKVYSRINWLNKSESLTTPLGKTNLNKMDKAINLIDDEVVSMSAKIDEIDTTKVSADQLNNMVTDVSFNDKNGVISITKHNGTVLNFDTAMEKIAANFEYNAQTQQLILTLENGEKQYIDMSALITQYEFKDTDTIAFSVDSDGKVSASIKSGSITKAMLSSEVMSAITLSENNAAASAQAAAQSATNSELDSKMSQSYAVGKSGIRDGEDTDNAKYYCDLAEKHKDSAAMSESNAGISETNAKASESNAATSESNAKISETIAEEKASEAGTSAETATSKANEVAISASVASESEKNAKKSEKLSRSYAIGDADGTRENEDTDNSKYYAAQAEKYAKQAEDIAGGNFIPDSEKGMAGGVAVLNDNLAVEKAVADEDGNNIKDTYATKQQVPDLVKVDNETITKDENGILHGAMSVDVDSELSETSENPVQNKVITKALQEKANTDNVDALNRTITELQENKADKAEVPKLVKVDGTTVFLSEDGVLSAKGGGSSIKPKPVSDVSIVSAKSKVTIKWTDPTDIVVDGAVLSQWQKTVLMYKQGTVPPTSLNDGTIAVEETTRNQYQSTGYGISLADGYDYSFSLFAISTDGTSSDKVSVSAELYATLTVTTEEASLYGKAVTVTSGSQKVTGTFSNSGSVTLRIPWMGNTTISATDGTDTTTATVNIAEYGKSYNAELSFFKIVTFADGTDEEIAAMMQAHYDNKINIADYWAVGDKRSVNLSAMSATYVGESHRAQTVQFAIADFGKDELSTPINGHTMAAITLTQVNCLMDATSANNSNNGSNDTEKGYMNSTNTNVGGWKGCARRTWCNNVYFGALPTAWQSMIKTVNKKVSVGNNSSTIETVQDKIFLAAEIEIFGSTTYSFAGEGTQYQYYKNATANRYKMPKWTSSYVSHIYWERSPRSGNTSHFCIVSNTGGANFYNAGGSWGVAPCLCI